MSKDKALCPVCKRLVPLGEGGVLQTHNTLPIIRVVCGGSGQPPLAKAEVLLCGDHTWYAARANGRKLCLACALEWSEARLMRALQLLAGEGWLPEQLSDAIDGYQLADQVLGYHEVEEFDESKNPLADKGGEG